MDPIRIIITDQPLGMTGAGDVAVSPALAFVFIVFLTVICSYVGYKALIWILEAMLPCR